MEFYISIAATYKKLIELYIYVSRYYNVDVSVAVSTDSGLITPIVFNADKKVHFVSYLCVCFRGIRYLSQIKILSF